LRVTLKTSSPYYADSSYTAERVVRDVKSDARPFDAVIKGVDDPWDVCLMRFFWMHTSASMAKNMEDFKNAGMIR